MGPKFNISALKQKTGVFSLWVDIFMLILIIINLAFLIFDWHFSFAFFRNFLERLSPSFFAYYRDEVHPNFLLYDLFFVSLYILELLVSWGIAVKRKTHDKWYFYPLIHWYDILGCIPVGSFRWLRILRVFSIMLRLHKLGVVDLTESYLYKEGVMFYKIVMEEVSDRVVIKILNGIEGEIKHDSPVSTRMVSEILKPHQETIAKWLSLRIKQVAEHNYGLYRNDLKNYIEVSVSDAVKQNIEIKKINAIPIIGKQITHGLEHGVSNITYEAINGLISGLTTEENSKVIEDVINAVFESMLVEDDNKELNTIVKDIFIKAIEMVKDQVKVKRWKQNGVTPAAVQV